jgi:hypothetical protein
MNRRDIVKQRSKGKHSELALVFDKTMGTVALKTNGASLVFDGKTKTITLKAASIVIDGRQILIQRANGKRPMKLSDIVEQIEAHRHQYYNGASSRNTSEPIPG